MNISNFILKLYVSYTSYFPLRSVQLNDKHDVVKQYANFLVALKLSSDYFLQESNIYKLLEIILIFIVLSVALAKSVPFSLVEMAL